MSEMYIWICAFNKGSGQPAHLCSLIWIFTELILDSQEYKVDNKDWAQEYKVDNKDWADVQTDLNFCCAHMSQSTFSHVIAQIIFVFQ